MSTINANSNAVNATSNDSNPAASTFPQKGDIKVYNGLAWVTLPIGADTQVLTADATQATGMKWA